MSALEIAIGITALIVFAAWVLIIIYASAEDLRRHRLRASDVMIVGSLFGTVWFIARLWGFA